MPEEEKQLDAVENSNDKDIATKKESKDPNIKKKTSKKVSSDSRNPINTARETLDAVAGLPSIDVDDLISNLLKNTENSVINSVDWKSVYQALSADEKNADISETIKHISSLDFITSSSQMERLNKYKDFIMILKRVPIIKKILRLYTSNILSPDDISKISLKIIPKNPTINKSSEEYISIENKYKVILDKINLEDKLYDLVFKTLFYGDMFVEILSSKRYLLQTLYNFQIPIQDKNIKINEDRLDNIYEDITTINMECGYKGNIEPYQINIEWEKPVMSQFNETLDFANVYLHALFKNMGATKNNYHKVKNNGFLRYLSEEFFGTSSMFDNAHNYRIFHEAFDEAFTTTSTDASISSSAFSNISRITNPLEDEEAMAKRYSLDYLPVQATLSSLNVKIHTPDKVIVLKDEEIEYGYLYVSSGLENVMGNYNTNNSNSAIASNGVDSGSVINTSNFVNQSNVQNSMGMFGDGTRAAKLNHAKQISARISQFIKTKFEEYSGDVNIDNMSSNLQTLIADILNNGSNVVTVRYIPPLNMQHFKIEGTGLNNPYGEAITEDLLFRAKMLLADDINGIINKFTATGKRMVWVVNANTHQQAANRIQQLSRSVNKKTVATDNCLDIMASAIFPQDNIFIAKVNGERQVEVETLDLGAAEDSTNSNNYLIKQLITGYYIYSWTT